MNDERKKGSGKKSMILILFLIGVSAILEVIWIGAISSILIVFLYVYYSRILASREKRIIEIERAPINEILKKIVNDNVEVEASWIYRCYKKGEKAGTMLIYEECYCRKNASIKEIMQEYHDIVLKEYDNLNRTEIDFVSRTGGRVYVSLRTNIYGKDYVVVFIISAKSSIEQKELDSKIERVKKNFILRSKL